MNSLSISEQDNKLVVRGELTLHSISGSFEKKSLALLSPKLLDIDFSDVTSVDTAGLAWMLTMQEHALSNNLSIKFSNIPNNLKKLAQLSAVDSFLAVQ